MNWTQGSSQGHHGFGTKICTILTRSENQLDKSFETFVVTTLCLPTCSNFSSPVSFQIITLKNQFFSCVDNRVAFTYNPHKRSKS